MTRREFGIFGVVATDPGEVAHLAYTGTGSGHEFGAWYAACGRVVRGWTHDALGDTDAQRVCARCAARVARIVA